MRPASEVPGPVTGSPGDPPSSAIGRVGVLLPYRGVVLPETVGLGVLVERLGFGSVWAAEIAGADAFAQLAAVAAATTTVGLGTAVVPLGSRTPALLGMSAATVAALSGGRFALGVGVSSPQVMEAFHGLGAASPVAATRDALTILDAVLAGRRTGHHGEVFSSTGFALTVPVVRPPVLLAALGPRMRRLACERADGVILNFAPRSAVGELVSSTAVGERPFRRLVLVRVALESGPDEQAPGERGLGERGAGERALRRELASYMRVPPYARWFAGLGLGGVVADVTAHADLDAMAAALPDEVVRDISVLGTPAEWASALRTLAAAGLDPIIVPTTGSRDPAAVEDFLQALAPHLIRTDCAVTQL